MADELARLAEEVEGAAEGSFRLNASVGQALHPDRRSVDNGYIVRGGWKGWPDYTSSLDAVVALIRERLPGCGYTLEYRPQYGDWAASVRSQGAVTSCRPLPARLPSSPPLSVPLPPRSKPMRIDADEIARTIASRMRELRTERGFTLQQVADAIGSTKSHVWSLEKGDMRNPSIAMTMGLARALGVSVDYLTGVTTSTPPLHRDAMRIACEIDSIIRVAQEANHAEG